MAMEKTPEALARACPSDTRDDCVEHDGEIATAMETTEVVSSRATRVQAKHRRENAFSGKTLETLAEVVTTRVEDEREKLVAMEALGIVPGRAPEEKLRGLQRPQQPPPPHNNDVGSFNQTEWEEKGVQAMLKSLKLSQTHIPEYYIKPLHLRHLPQRRGPGSQLSIPVVDLAAPYNLIVRDIGRACEYGFFQIINHGIPLDLLGKIKSEAEQFFALPTEEKVKCSTERKVFGPVHFGGGSRGDWRDVLKLQYAPPSEVVLDLWPSSPDGFRSTLVYYTSKTQALATKLLQIISESLGLEKDYIQVECKEPRVLIAINHYPPCPDPTLTMGIREHSDPNTITLILQDEVEGLQVLKDGLWIDVQPLEGGLIVNVGDHLQILSNGRYLSCLHRVVNNKWKSRISIAIFYSPANTSLIKSAPALVDDKHPAMYREFHYKDFLKDFYLNGGPNGVTLSHFRNPAPTI